MSRDFDDRVKCKGVAYPNFAVEARPDVEFLRA